MDHPRAFRHAADRDRPSGRFDSHRAVLRAGVVVMMGRAASMPPVRTTDAVVGAGALRPFWKRVVRRTFNAISVDRRHEHERYRALPRDGHAGHRSSRDGATWKLFEEAATEVARKLALAVVEDGEGASKQLEIHITGAQTEAHAREVGRAIARSTLVKTAIYGGDRTGAGCWRRPASRRWRSCATADVGKRNPRGGPWLTLAERRPHRARRSGEGTHHLPAKNHPPPARPWLGRSEAVVWTCDLSPDYVRINSDYTS